MINIGIIGLGYWGGNYLRIFSQIEKCKILLASDINEDRLKKMMSLYPNIEFTKDYDKIIKNKKIDAVIISTPTSTHYDLVKKSLLNKKDVLVEKPLCITYKESEELVNIALSKNLILMVGHTFLYNDSIRWLKKYIERKHCGKIYYLHAIRTNLGPIRTDVNAIYDLASHDVSIFIYLLEQLPLEVSSQASFFINDKIEDIGFITLKFNNNILGHIHVSWLEPCKIRKITVIGDKKMIVFDDVNIIEPIKIYDKGVIKEKDYSDFGEFHLILRDGDVLIPKITITEPLKNQCIAFLKSIINRKKPLSDGVFGANVVKVLEGCNNSIKQNSKYVKV